MQSLTRYICLLATVILCTTPSSIQLLVESKYQSASNDASHAAYAVRGADSLKYLLSGKQVLGSCLEKHQYKAWYRFAKSRACMRMVDMAEAAKHASDHKDQSTSEDITSTLFERPPRDVFRDSVHQEEEADDDDDEDPSTAVGLVEKMFSIIKNILENEPNIDGTCSIVSESLVPCLKEIDAPLVTMLRDRENCEALTNVVGDDFNLKHFWSMINHVTNAICGQDDSTSSSQKCGQVILTHMMDRTGKFLTGKFAVVGALVKCRWNVGSCCASPLRQLIQRLERFDLYQDWIPEAKSDSVSSKMSLLRYLLAYCGGDAIDEDEIDFPSAVTDIPGKCLNSPSYYFPEVSLPDDVVTEPMQPPLSPLIIDIDPSYPQQVHIALADVNSDGVSNDMNVMWTTESLIESRVQYGTKRRNLNFVSKDPKVTSYSKELADSDTNGVEIDVSYQHAVTLTELQPDTRYYYQVVNAVNASKIFDFKTLPAAALHKSLAIFGDFGNYETFDTREALLAASDEIGMYVHAGDVAYADNDFLHNIMTFGYEKTWNAFQRGIEPLAASKPYMVVPGNHDFMCHSPVVCMPNDVLRKHLAQFKAYNARFTMPSQSSGGFKNLWYSFNYGEIHVVVIDTESDFPNAPDTSLAGEPIDANGDQDGWLHSDLESVDREVTPWIVVVGHRPIYAQTDGYTNATTGAPMSIAKTLQNWLEPVFEKFNVDLYIAGHKHRYERMTPVHDSKAFMTPESTSTHYVSPTHTTHIVNGAAGNEELHGIIDAHRKEKMPKYVVTTDDENYGIGLLKAVSASTLEWEFRSTDGKTMDRFQISK